MIENNANNAWIDYGKTWDEFSNDKLNQPGALIEVLGAPFDFDGTKLFLIGHINPLSGECDDCTAFRGNATVVRYTNLCNEKLK